ncbi:Ananain, partial [Ananas comosus]
MDGPTMTMFEDWMSEHGRTYANAKEKQQRYEIFKNNVKYIEGFNKVGGRSYTLGVNRFSDMTNEEYANTYAVGIAEQDIPTDIETALVEAEYENTPLRATVDRRTQGATVESIYKIKKGELKSLSVQQVLDCSDGGDCSGGSRLKAFRYIVANKGLTTEANYPYKASKGVCDKTKESDHAAYITGCRLVTRNNEAKLMKAANDQPVSVAVNARTWQHYKGGIFDEDCSPDVTHSVVIVGYGEESGKKYWIVKNSAGPKWGESGYIRIAKDVAAKEGLCGIATAPLYPSWNTRMDGPTMTMFEDWMSEHGRTYANAKEKQQRYEIFKNNVKYIEEFNKVGGRSYTLGVNRFSDMTNEEYANTAGHPNRYRDRSSGSRVRNTRLRATVDWRTQATVESIYKIKKGELKSLSVQQVLDCSNGGDCSGSSRLKAFLYIIANKGLTTEANYPYKASKGVCDKTKESDHAAYITGYRLVTRNNEAELMKAVNDQPVTVAVNATTWQHYKGGIFDEDCSPDVTHTVAVVGYGEESGRKYWILKNSPGPKWGESGYMRIAKDVAAKEGLCGIATAPLY